MMSDYLIGLVGKKFICLYYMRWSTVFVFPWYSFFKSLVSITFLKSFWYIYSISSFPLLLTRKSMTDFEHTSKSHNKHTLIQRDFSKSIQRVQMQIKIKIRDDLLLESWISFELKYEKWRRKNTNIQFQLIRTVTVSIFFIACHSKKCIRKSIFTP